jgi:ribosomal protein L7/L12
VRLVAGLARAGSRWLARTARRRGDIEAESAVASSLGELKGVTMKLGQMLGYTDLGLPRNLMAALSALHTHAQPIAFDRLRAVLESDLGVAGASLAARMQPTPIASGSLGQVHRSTLDDGTEVAVKVLYPGIGETIARDLAPATLGGRLAQWVAPRSPLAGWVREVRERVLEECDYRLEARRQRAFAERFAGHPTIDVPAVHEAWCSPRVLTTGLVEGVHLDSYLVSAPSADSRATAAGALFDFYLGSLFGAGLYASDPHPGNYLFRADGTVAFVDFGAARELDADTVARMWDLLAPSFPDEVRAFTVPPAAELIRRGSQISNELPLLLRTLYGLQSALSRLDAHDNWYRRLHPASAPEPEAEPELNVDVLLLSPGDSPIAVVRAIRDLTDLPLRDIRELIDTRSGVIARAIPERAADRLRQRLESAGARVSVRPARRDP